MKTLKRIFALAMVVCAMFALTACSGSVVGEWELVEASFDMIGVHMDMVEAGMTMDLDINEDETFVMSAYIPSYMGSEPMIITVTGTWELDDDELILTADNASEEIGIPAGDTDHFIWKDGQLKSEMSETVEGMTVTMSIAFEKK